MRLAAVITVALVANTAARYVLMRWWNQRSDLRSAQRFARTQHTLDRARGHQARREP